MIKELTSLYSTSYPSTLVYMLQSNEYQAKPYLKWYWKTSNFNHVSRRGSLRRTRVAKMLLAVLWLGISLQLFFGAGLIATGLLNQHSHWLLAGLLVVIWYPLVWAHLLVVPLEAGRLLVSRPKERKLIALSKSSFAQTKAVKIAVAGSYGKTTVKELLLTILSEGKRVVATPANKNVASSHAVFASRLNGDEEVLIIELGEGKPGDVKNFADTIRPDIGLIAGLAPAHLDHYKTIKAAGEDIFSLADFVRPSDLFVNSESPPLKDFLKPNFQEYSSKKVDGWKISKVIVEVSGTSFDMEKGHRKLKLHSGLLGKHLVGALACGVALAARLDMTDDQIVAGVSKTKPFEHRMEPRPLSGGWIIDDTYNGNIEGVRAGLELLKQLPAKRKLYVTPGLVEQGAVSQQVHTEMGVLIAKAQPNQVILMKNSVTSWIEDGLKKGGYQGIVLLEDDPLTFYSNLDQIIAAGDLLLMQNDWPDNYK